MNVKSTTLSALAILSCAIGFSQETPSQTPLDTVTTSVINLKDDLGKLKKLKVTGYLQPQFQYIDSAGAASVSGGNFAPRTDSRFMMRRGRVKFTYENGIAQYLMNIDVTEKGVLMRETFVKITDPWLKSMSIAAGCSQIPFGFEITQSSSIRETPERARYNQTLFPTERDLGAFIVIQAPKTSPWSILRLDAAILNGVAGVNPEFDSHKDYVGRLSVSKTNKSEKITFAGGVSYYTGGYRQAQKKEYDFGTLANGNKGYTLSSDTANYEHVAKREYMGADAQLTMVLPWGINVLRAEYIQGYQPGTASASSSATASPTSDIYHRQFNGAYFYFIQNIGQSKFQVVAKYDWYDPNTKVSGKDIGKAGTNTKNADIKYDTYGFGLTCRLDANVKVTAYYDIVKNEAVSIKGYTKDIPDNVFTLRLQCKF